MNRAARRLLPFVAMLLAWAAFTETGVFEHRALATPSDTLEALLGGLGDGSLVADLGATALRLGLGLALGLLLGTPLGLLIGTRARRHDALEPAMDFLRAIPPLLVFPVLLLALGYGDSARVGAIGYASSLVFALHLSSALRRVPRGRVDALRAMGASRTQVLRHVHLYEVIPGALTGVRHAVSTGLVVAVVTEMVVGAPEGLGTRAVSSQITYDTPGLYAVILVTGAFGFALGSLLLAVERRLVFWERAPAEPRSPKEPAMTSKEPTSPSQTSPSRSPGIGRLGIALSAVGAALVVVAALSSDIGAMGPGPVPEPTEGPDRVIDRVRELFPQTEGWFRIVATARFDTGSSGRIVPDYSALTHQRVRWEDASGHTILAQFAPTFHNATRIVSGEDPEAWIDVIPEGGRDVEAQIQDGLVVYPDAYRDTDVLYKSTPTHTDEYLLLRTREAPTRWVYRVRLGPGIAGLRQGGTAVEGFDARGVPWMRGNAPFAVDSTGRRVTGTIHVEGDRIVAEIDTSELELPILVDPDWRSTGDMSFGRFYFGLNLLPDGRLLASGGCSASICSGDLTLPACRAVVNAGETLDLDTRTWSRAGDGVVRAFFHVAESLDDGSVLVAGGCATSDCASVTGLAEIYDVSMSAFRTVAPLPEPNAGFVSARLPDGRILVAGGCDRSVCSIGAQAFDPTTESWTALADMNTARGRASVATLSDGRILVTGGCTNILCSGVLASAEVYDPVADSWTAVSDMSTARGGHYAATLLDGRVLVGGGCITQSCMPVLDTTEFFDPTTESFSAGGTQVRPRVGAAAVRLPDGSVMVNQGCASTIDCDLSNERFDPSTGAFAAIESAVTVRAFHETVLHGPRDTIVAVGGCQPRTCSWWNETYDVSHLMAPPDGGVPMDDGGVTSDGGVADAGPAALDGGGTSGDGGSTPDAGDVPVEGGCGCRVQPGTTGAGWLAFIGLALFAMRRRRS